MLFDLNFLTSSEIDIRCFGNLVKKGKIGDSKINETFEKIKSNTYSEEDSKTIIKNLIIASHNVDSERTDYQTPLNETLLYMVKFININGSINLKILYALFPFVITTVKDKKNNEYYIFNEKSDTKINSEFSNRLHYMNEKDKKEDIAKEIKEIYTSLRNKVHKSSFLI